MHKELSDFAAQLREAMLSGGRVPRGPDLKIENVGSCNSPLRGFESFALELFALQFQNNPDYREICRAREVTPESVEHWTQIPAVPTAAFKELELTCLPPSERTAVFHSSGTSEQAPSRHFHSAESLAVYEVSLWRWFAQNVLRSADGSSARNSDKATRGQAVRAPFAVVCLTPPPAQAPHSSLVHMFETVRRKLGAPDTAFVGRIAADGSWTLNFDAAVVALSPRRRPDSLKRANEGGTPDARSQTPDPKPLLLLGTAFSFVHLLDYLDEKNSRFDLPAGSRVMETGGYKNRSRSMPKTELHALITERLGIPPENIVSEYGMSELSSQAYAVASDKWQVARETASSCHLSPVTCHFRFPPWARVQIVSPETGSEVAEGETGLIRVFDLASVVSVMAIQTEDLAIRRGDEFELIGRAQLAEPRGCSLMSDSAIRIPHSALK
jgi:hypothetical protein